MKSEWGRSSVIIHLKLWSTCLFTFYVLFIWFLLVFFFVLRDSLSFPSLRRFVSALEVFKKTNWRPIIARQVTQIPNNPLSMLIPFKAIVSIQILHLFLNVIGWNQPILCYSLFCSCLPYSLIPWVNLIWLVELYLYWFN